MNAKRTFPLFLLALAFGTAAVASGEILARFNGERENGDEGTVKNGAWSNYKTTSEIVAGVDREGDGVPDDTVRRIPWRSDLTPMHADYPVATESTHAGSPMWGGLEWVAFRTNSVSVLGSNIRFMLNDLTADSNHGNREFLNYRVDFPNVGNKTPVDGTAYGAVILELDRRTPLCGGSVFTVKTHNRDFNGPFTGRWVIETDPAGDGNPENYVTYISEDTFAYVGNQSSVYTNTADSVYHVYDPATSIRFNPLAAGEGVRLPLLGVVGVGFYFDRGPIRANVDSYLVRLTVCQVFIDVCAALPTLLMIQ